MHQPKLGCLKGRRDLDYTMYVYVAVLVQTGASLGVNMARA